MPRNPAPPIETGVTTAPNPTQAEDDLDQIAHELSVIWLALGNPDDAQDHLMQIGEHVYALARRVVAVSDTLGKARK